MPKPAAPGFWLYGMEDVDEFTLSCRVALWKSDGTEYGDPDGAALGMHMRCEVDPPGPDRAISSPPGALHAVPIPLVFARCGRSRVTGRVEHSDRAIRQTRDGHPVQPVPRRRQHVRLHARRRRWARPNCDFAGRWYRPVSQSVCLWFSVLLRPLAVWHHHA